MEPYTERLKRPRLATIYALIITITSILGLLGFILLYFTEADYYLAKLNVSPIVLGMSLFIFSILGLLTGSGLLFRKKFGWVLAHFLLLYIIINSLYTIVLLPLFNINVSSAIILDFLKIALLVIICAYLIFYFNQKKVTLYYGIEKEEAQRMYLINFLSCIMIIFISGFL